MLTKENIQDIYGLAPMQESMLIQHARSPESEAYVEQFDFRIQGEVQVAVLQKSLDLLMAKYDALRTIFSFRKTDLPRQIVLKTLANDLHCEDFSNLVLETQEEAITAFKLWDRKRNFNLSQGPLLRVSLLRRTALDHHIIVTFHHIILDGWCLGPIFQDLFSWYEQLLENPSADLREQEAHPYREYIRWLEEQDQQKAQDYWKDYLQGYQAEVGIPYFDRPHAGEVEHAVHLFSLGNAMSQGLAELARCKKLTVNALFQTAWGVLLQKYQNTDDVVFGTVVSGRPPQLPGIEQMVGLFINTQAMRVACTGDEAFSKVASRVQEQNFRSVAFEHYPLFEIQSHSALANRLLNHIVAFENYPIGQRMKEMSARGKGLRVLDVQVFEQTNYDFNVIVLPGQEIKVNFTYNRLRFSEEVVQGLSRSLITLLQQILEHPDTPIRSLRICSEMDAERILRSFNDTSSPYPNDRTVPELFQETVKRFGDQPALLSGGRSWTYAQLDRVARVEAIALREQGVSPGTTVGLLMPRCPELMIAILGILHAGATYVPIELANTPDRIAHLLKDSGAILLATVSDQAHRVPEGTKVHLVEAPDDVEAPADMELPTNPQAPAYIMYTSGSTGLPKGCAITHQNIVRLVRGNDFVEFAPRHRILLTGSPAFDATTFEFWGALLHGGMLCMAGDYDILDSTRLKNLLLNNGITILWLTSALFNQLCESDAELFQPLEYLLVGGDALSPRHIQKARSAHPHLKIINGYGPTENTTFSTTFLIDQDFEQRIPIGRPIKNSTAYVVDSEMNLLPPGAFGELIVGGDGVGLGYLGCPELTAQKFLQDPFRQEGRAYCTGDIVRWLPDGTLDMLGRNDFQVKIRGFRVELGEIERTICTLPGVQEAVVTVMEDKGGKQLCAYVVGNLENSAQDLRGALSSKLPGYMVPAFFMSLDKLPLTTNGKVDRRALPVMDTSQQLTTNVVVEPRSVTETRIREICQEVLSLDQISIHDNFFEIGATSLNLITINNKLKTAFSRDIPVAALFEYTSVARLAEFLNTDASAEKAKLSQETEQLDQAKASLLKTRNRMRTMEEQL